MKESITDQINNLYKSGLSWLKLEVEYAKLTAVEKATVLLSTLVLGAVCLLLGIVIVILLSFSLADVFKGFLSPWLAYLCVSGILLLMIVMVFLLRRPLLENPISRLISRLFLDIKPRNTNEQN